MKKKIVLTSVVLTAAMLCGCMNGETSKRRVKQEIVVACGKNLTGAVEDVMNDFTAQSDTTQVKLIEFSSDSRELCRAYAAILSGKEVPLDAMLTEDVWTKEFTGKGFLAAFDDAVSFEDSAYQKSIPEFARVDGKIYWYPLILDMGLMYYRTDITDGTLDYRQLSEQSDKAYSIQGADGEEMICCAMEFINMTGSVENGIRLYKKAIENAAVPNSNSPVTDFLDGNAAYVRVWASENGSITKGYPAVSSKAATKVLKNPDGKSYATARAYGISMNAASEKKENVKELLKYLAGDDVRLQILRKTETLPLKREDYENSSVSYYADYIEKAYPMFETFKFRPNKSNYSYLSICASNALSDYINGEGTAEDAAKAMSALLENTEKQ